MAAFLLGWQLVSERGSLRESLPAPVEVGRALVSEARSGALAASAGETLTSWSVGLLLALAAALPLGLAIGSSRLAFLSSRLTIDVLRTIPPVTLVPLAVLVYGPTLRMKLVLIVYGTLWPLLLQIIYAVREVDPVARDMARAYRISAALRWRMLLLPSALPFLLTGLRVGATLALLLSIGAEIIGDAPGLGRSITQAQIAGLSAQAYAYVVATAGLGIVVNGVLVAAQRRLLFWQGAGRAARS